MTTRWLCYQDSWIAIDDPLAYDGKTRQIKARVFENASMGCVVATQPNERLHRYYEPGREILFWETPSDLIRLIHDSIENPQPYRRMARRPTTVPKREHLYDHRFARSSTTSPSIRMRTMSSTRLQY